MTWLPVVPFFLALGLLLAGAALPHLDAIAYALLGVGLAISGAALARGKPPAVRRAGWLGLLLGALGMGGLAWLHGGP